ncbi:MAG TPA: GGDEF domain-containing protein [Rhizobiaceae bacterium]|nr:GGDEF domain-containing protein [Rhizobiaceae bacterium]
MSGAGFILGINLVVAGLLASAFLAIALYDTSRVAARWIALSYLLGMVYFAIEAFVPLFSDARPPVATAFAAFLGALLAFNIGVARKYQVKSPTIVMAVIFAVATIIVWFVQDLPRHSFTRMFAYQAPYFLMQAIAAGLVLASRPRRQLDRALAVLFALSSLQFLSKPLLAFAFGGWGENPQAYLESNYALVSQSMGTVFGLAVALMMFIVLMRDVLEEATTKSETDTLSGLLNRRGFEARAEHALRSAARHRMPLSLVICDLDRFKAVNDTYGHEAGDKVIEAFAQFLRSTTEASHATGRIGGEEFAIILPGTNLVAARLFAEGARSTFATIPVEGLPEGLRFTASFGVAELMPGEAISGLMRRADAALYEAKNAGRDCVRVSKPVSVPRQLAG